MHDATLTDACLADLEALCQAATPGPWQCADPMVKDRMMVSDAVGEVCKTDLYGFEYPESFSNGEFIAAARTAIPALIAEIRRLRAISSLPRVREKPDVPNTWLSANGEDYACKCGCKLFNQPDRNIPTYYCNKCGAEHEGMI